MLRRASSRTMSRPGGGPHRAAPSSIERDVRIRQQAALSSSKRNAAAQPTDDEGSLAGEPAASAAPDGAPTPGEPEDDSRALAMGSAEGAAAALTAATGPYPHIQAKAAVPAATSSSIGNAITSPQASQLAPAPPTEARYPKEATLSSRKSSDSAILREATLPKREPIGRTGHERRAYGAPSPPRAGRGRGSRTRDVTKRSRLDERARRAAGKPSRAPAANASAVVPTREEACYP